MPAVNMAKDLGKAICFKNKSGSEERSDRITKVLKTEASWSDDSSLKEPNSLLSAEDIAERHDLIIRAAKKPLVRTSTFGTYSKRSVRAIKEAKNHRSISGTIVLILGWIGKTSPSLVGWQYLTK